MKRANYQGNSYFWFLYVSQKLKNRQNQKNQKF
jgi:hypothetical protein